MNTSTETYRSKSRQGKGAAQRKLEKRRKMFNEATDCLMQAVFNAIKSGKFSGTWNQVFASWNQLPKTVRFHPLVHASNTQLLNHLGCGEIEKAVLILSEEQDNQLPDKLISGTMVQDGVTVHHVTACVQQPYQFQRQPEYVEEFKIQTQDCSDIMSEYIKEHHDVFNYSGRYNIERVEKRIDAIPVTVTARYKTHCRVPVHTFETNNSHVIVYSGPGNGKSLLQECKWNGGLIFDTDEGYYKYPNWSIIFTNDHQLAVMSKGFVIFHLPDETTWNKRCKTKCRQWQPSWYKDVTQSASKLSRFCLLLKSNRYLNQLMSIRHVCRTKDLG